VYFEAGAIGQRLYLGAEALHWNATGIGAFYDDDVHAIWDSLKKTPILWALPSTLRNNGRW